MTGASGKKKPFDPNLPRRFFSAMVLIPIGLFAVWQGGIYLALLALCAAGGMAFEWSRMIRTDLPRFLIFSAILANAVFLVDPRWALMCLSACGVLAMAIEMRKGANTPVLLGVLYTGGIPLAMQALRATPEAGQLLAIGILVITWASDTFAYFVGRYFKGPLLAPQDSPNKTWSGAIGGLLGSIIIAGLYAGLFAIPVIAWMLAGFVISLSAQIGDLFESQIKRRHGIKDTSGFLPGHGGLMDRLDGLGMACFIIFLLSVIIPNLGLTLSG